MTNAEEAIIKVFQDSGEIYLPCKDEKQQESIRVSAFNIRRKMPPDIQDTVAITKHEEDGTFYVLFYKREKSALMQRDPETGRLTPVDTGISPELARIIEIMRKDGKSEEEIQDFLKSA